MTKLEQAINKLHYVKSGLGNMGFQGYATELSDIEALVTEYIAELNVVDDDPEDGGKKWVKFDPPANWS